MPINRKYKKFKIKCFSRRNYLIHQFHLLFKMYTTDCKNINQVIKK